MEPPHHSKQAGTGRYRNRGRGGHFHYRGRRRGCIGNHGHQRPIQHGSRRRGGQASVGSRLCVASNQDQLSHSGESVSRHRGAGRQLGSAAFIRSVENIGGGGRSMLSPRGQGWLQAANPTNSATPPMTISGLCELPLVFNPEDRVRNVLVRVVEDLPYELIIEAAFLRKNGASSTSQQEEASNRHRNRHGCHSFRQRGLLRQKGSRDQWAGRQKPDRTAQGPKPRQSRACQRRRNSAPSGHSEGNRSPRKSPSRRQNPAWARWHGRTTAPCSGSYDRPDWCWCRAS